VKFVLVISERDNVATALQPLRPGQQLDVNGIMITVQHAIPSGHKIALTTIRPGESVVKYGSPIGLASAEILPGAHVHTHNVASTRGRGDLDISPAGEPQPRLAEPPDERNGAERPAAERHAE
jgi:altronate dehydratase